MKAKCQINNKFTTGSAFLELQAEGLFRIREGVHTKMPISGTAQRDFGIGFTGVDFKSLCPTYSRAALADNGKQARTYYDSVRELSPTS